MDSRLQKMLSESGLKYQVDGNWVRLGLELNDGRSQLVRIYTEADVMGRDGEAMYEDFDVISAVAPMSKVTPQIALKLLDYASERKLGGLMRSGDTLFLKHDLAANSDGKALLAVFATIAKDADDLERALTAGGDDF